MGDVAAKAWRERAILRGRRRYGPLGNVWLIEEVRGVAGWAGLSAAEVLFRLQSGLPLVQPIERVRARRAVTL